MATFRFVNWLISWIESQEYFAFDWDLGNRTKNFIKHEITTEEAESVFNQTEVIRILGEQVSPKVNDAKIRNSWRHKHVKARVSLLYDPWFRNPNH